MLNHLGVELTTTEDVAKAAVDFEQAGLTTWTAESEICCHAAQDKVYVAAPDVPLDMWENYTVVDDNPADAIGEISGNCCVSPDDVSSPSGSDKNACCS